MVSHIQLEVCGHTTRHDHMTETQKEKHFIETWSQVIQIEEKEHN